MKPLDFAVICLLGLSLLAAGWRDSLSFGRDQRNTFGGVDLLAANRQAQHVEAAELFVRGGNLLLVDGLAGLENLGYGPFRHGLGPAMRLVIHSEVAREAIVKLRFFNGIPHQDLVFRYDGNPLEELHDLPTDQIERTFHLPLGPGEHTFRMEYALWSQHGAEPVPGDGRALVGPFGRLRVEFR